MSGYETLLYDLSDDVATVTLNRPDKMNAMNAAMRKELAHAADRAAAEARALLLTGAPSPSGRQAFCAGQDLGDVRDEDLESVLLEEYAPAMRAIIESPIPTIAAVNGAAAGAGAHLAFAADIAIAARSAKFVEPFARIGLMAAGAGSYLLPRKAGMPRALGMILLGEPVDAPRAADWGLIWEAVADDQTLPRAREIAQKLAQGPTAAFRLGKEAMRASLGSELEDQLALEARLQGEAGRTRDYLEGVAAFLEKRAPRFEGR